MINVTRCFFLVLSCQFPGQLVAQKIQIGIIDYYGLGVAGAPTEKSISGCLRLKVGDVVDVSTQTKSEIVSCLKRLPSVTQADMNMICCDENNQLMIFVGVSQQPAPGVDSSRYRKDIHLPTEIILAYDSLMEGMINAVQTGQAGEDDRLGHALFRFPGATRQQRKFINFANQNLVLLRDVLKTSQYVKDRTVAACVIAYYRDKKAIVDDLMSAVTDPDIDVRNDAIRAIGIMDRFFYEQKMNVTLDPGPFIRLMNSIVWTDRNKSAVVLGSMTNARDPMILSRLKKEALMPLADMARWKSEGHAFFGFVVLGRIAGWPNKEIFDRIKQDREKAVKEMLKQIGKG